MDFFSKIGANIKMSTILKVFGVVLLALVVLAFSIRLIGSSFKSGAKSYDLSYNESSVSSGSQKIISNDMMFGKTGGSAELSVRNVAPANDSYRNKAEDLATTQNTAMEVAEYSALIETRKLNETCSIVAGLKNKDFIVFENSSEQNRRCSYSFKVKKDKVTEILSIIKALDPKEMSENVYTIKKAVDDFTGQEEILKNKLKAIDETLSRAVTAYDQVSDVATQSQNADGLARAIDSKINLIERLTQERININAQLENLGRSKAEQLDRLEYTYFHVSISENKFVDMVALKDSWKYAIKRFVVDINSITQDITINLASFLYAMLQYIIYFLILLFTIKYGWKLIKKVWFTQPPQQQ